MNTTKMKEPKGKRKFIPENLRAPLLITGGLGAVLAVSYLVDSIHIKVRTRAHAAITEPAPDTGRPNEAKILLASGLPLPEVSISVDEDEPKLACVPPLEDFELDVPLLNSANVPCPPNEPLCHVEFNYGIPRCINSDESCFKALSDNYSVYVKNVGTAVTEVLLPPAKGPWIFGPYGVKPPPAKIPESAPAATPYVKKTHGSITVQIVRSHNRKDDKTHESELDLASKIVTSQPTQVAPLIYYIMDPNRTEALSGGEAKMMFDISKKLLNDDEVKKILAMGDITCNDIVAAVTVFINEQLEKAAEEGSGEVTKNQQLIRVLAEQLGFEKLPPTNQWMWVKVPESLIKKEVCED